MVSACVLRHSVVSSSSGHYGLWPSRFLCPWDSPDKNTGLGSHFLLQGIFPTQGSNSCLSLSPALQADSLPLSHLGSPLWWVEACKGEVAASQSGRARVETTVMLPPAPAPKRAPPLNAVGPVGGKHDLTS